ncbi:MAG: hypothetical protein BWY74_00139 [Firmicutes bacterium ADurb.Bin419]|nr:MAG: hypothetical protein BWY74_00139 [Firmicutes bacterium ADurb.Bin419]
MKKIVFLILVTLFAAVSAINAYAGNSLKLFYNGKFLSLSQEIISVGDEYFVNAKELSAVVGTRCKIDTSNKTLSLQINNSVRNYEIKSYDYTIMKSFITHNLPELINNKVYFPFSFITEEYDVIVKYDKKANYLYFFPNDSKINTFINNNCNYNLSIPENLYLTFDESQNFDTSTIYLTNEDYTFSASIVCDILNKAAVNNMRFLLSDYVSPESYIFDRMVEYKHSYFRSLLDSYKNEFLFGNMDLSLSESNIKIIKESTEELFGQNSNIVMFNTISSKNQLTQEDINIILTVPSYVNKSIYTIAFTMQKGHLNDDNINNILQVLKGLDIANHPNQENLPFVLLDNSSVEAANSGIYPSLHASEISYIELKDSINYYRFRYPSNFAPYLNNNLIDDHSYRSFKIDHNTYVSISVEHISGSPYRILEKINTLKAYYGSKIKITRIESKNINGKEFIVLDYEKENQNNGAMEYVTNYIIINGFRLYTLELNSLVSPPSEDISDEFLRIVSSFEFTKPENQKKDINNISFVKFTNQRLGYSIFYPDNWSLQDSSQDINYDSFVVTNPNYSGPLNIVLNEAEYASKLTTTELLRYTTGYDTEKLSKYFKNYRTPYSGKTHKVLISNIKNYNNLTVIYKLVNYLDEGDRYKLCYSIDLIKNNTINSLYISASEYLFQDNVLADKELNYILEFMCKSFYMSDSKESPENQISGEMRNNKIVFIENFFKNALGETTTVTYAENLSSEKDVLVYINNSSKAGAYKLNFDYNYKSIQVSSRVLQPDIEKAAQEKASSLFQNKTIHEIIFDWDNMTVSVKYSDTNTSPAQVKEYYLEVIPAKKEFSLNFIRKLSAESIKNNCQSFLENYLLTNVKVYFPKNYNYRIEDWNKQDHEKRQIPLYAEFDGLSGYFYLEVDPVTDIITILKYVSTNDLKRRIEDYYFGIDPTIDVINYQTDKFDNFCFTVSIGSEANGTSTQEIHAYFDLKNQDLLFSTTDLYLSKSLTK